MSADQKGSTPAHTGTLSHSQGVECTGLFYCQHPPFTYRVLCHLVPREKENGRGLCVPSLRRACLELGAPGSAPLVDGPRLCLPRERLSSLQRARPLPGAGLGAAWTMTRIGGAALKRTSTVVSGSWRDSQDEAHKGERHSSWGRVLWAARLEHLCVCACVHMPMACSVCTPA